MPFWTKRNPDYGTVMKTINARDDSLMGNSGMWTTMKKNKRCIIVAQGFYEWLKKNGGKEKIPHYTKRKDGQLMCFAGLWDCVQYEGMPLTGKSENQLFVTLQRFRREKLYVHHHHDRLQQATFVFTRPHASNPGEWVGSNSPLA